MEGPSLLLLLLLLKVMTMASADDLDFLLLDRYIVCKFT